MARHAGVSRSTGSIWTSQPADVGHSAVRRRRGARLRRRSLALGQRRGRRGRTARSAHVLIEYPAGWSAGAGGASIPGLAIAASAADRRRRGPPRMPGCRRRAARRENSAPLPRAFVVEPAPVAETAVVDLAEGQAYRYARLERAAVCGRADGLRDSQPRRRTNGSGLLRAIAAVSRTCARASRRSPASPSSISRRSSG